MEGKIVCNDHIVNYYKEGAGEKSFLFLHGWGQSGQTFLPFMHEIAQDGFTVIAPDLPGFGKSEMPNRPFSVDDYVTTILELISKLKLKTPIYIAGHSFGGRISIKIGADHPEIAKKIILINSAGVEDRKTVRNIILKGITRTGKLFFRLPGLRKFQEAAKKTLYRAVEAEDYTNAGSLKETFLKVIGENLSSCLPKIKAPTVIIWGEKDTVTKPEEAHIMDKAIPNSTLTIFKDAGHFSYLDQPKKFLSELRNAIT